MKAISQLIISCMLNYTSVCSKLFKKFLTAVWFTKTGWEMTSRLIRWPLLEPFVDRWRNNMSVQCSASVLSVLRNTMSVPAPLRHRLFVKKSTPAPTPILEFHSNSGWSPLLHSGSCTVHNCGLVLPWLISNQCCHFWFFNIRSHVLREISNVWCLGGKSDVDWAFDFVFHVFSSFKMKKCKNYNF